MDKYKKKKEKKKERRAEKKVKKKSSQRKERKATQTLAVVLGEFKITCLGTRCYIASSL